MRQLWRWVFRAFIAAPLSLAVVATALWWSAGDAWGGKVNDEQMGRIRRSPQWRGDHFDNRLARVDGPMLRSVYEFAFGGSRYRQPSGPLPVLARSAADYRTAPDSGLRVTWLGHSTLLLEIDGARVLIDPVWGPRASPFTFAGPKRFFEPPLPLSELPAVDAVIISHDHYDHLDVGTVKALLPRQLHWFVPLGVGAHLRTWGVPEALVTELDWWEEAKAGGLTITATPARHFSGRGIGNANSTLWSGWVFAGDTHRVFYSGDTSLHDQFAEIGARLGPFDLTMIEVGAYDALWADVHLGPEQAVRAHIESRGKVMLPVHWGLFDLALHGWTEPIERVLVEAARRSVMVATPQPGGMVEPSRLGTQSRWWPDVPWKRAEEAPVTSSGVTPE